MHVLLMCQRVQEVFGVQMPPERLFQTPLVSELAAVIDSGECAVKPIDWEAEAKLDPAITVPSGAPAQRPREVLLTGATGFLGSFILRDLLELTEAKIHCLVRAKDPSEGMGRIRAALEQFGVERCNLEGRVVAVTGDLGQPRMGLTEATFDELGETIEAVYHPAAKVDWIRPYADLRTANVIGTHEVIRFACWRKMKPLHAVSTLWVFPASWLGGVVAESDRPLLSGHESGYSQSKAIAEHLVWEAHRRGLPVTVHRMGFIANASGDQSMKLSDFIPCLIEDAVRLKCLPSTETQFELVPVDYISRQVVRLSLVPESIGKAFHLTNRDKATTSALVSAIRESGHTIEQVSYEEWKQQIRSDPKCALYPLYPFVASYDEATLARYLNLKIVDDVAVATLLRRDRELVERMPSVRNVVRAILGCLARQGGTATIWRILDRRLSDVRPVSDPRVVESTLVQRPAGRTRLNTCHLGEMARDGRGHATRGRYGPTIGDEHETPALTIAKRIHHVGGLHGQSGHISLRRFEEQRLAQLGSGHASLFSDSASLEGDPRRGSGRCLGTRPAPIEQVVHRGSLAGSQERP
jgi:thioester reductase-like protein